MMKGFARTMLIEVLKKETSKKRKLKGLGLNDLFAAKARRQKDARRS